MEDFGLEFAPKRPCSRGPSVAATRRDCQGSPPEPGAFSPRPALHDLGVCVSEYLRGLLADRRPLGTARKRGGCVRARARASGKHTEMKDRRRKIRNEMKCDTESGDLLDNHRRRSVVCFPRGGDSEAEQRQLMLGGRSPRPPTPPTPTLGSLLSQPSCHLSNDFFILQEEPVARGNAPLPAGGNPTLGRADAGTRYVCSHITRDQHILSSRLFLCFLFPLYPHSHQYKPFSCSSHLSSGGSALLLSSNSLPLTYE